MAKLIMRVEGADGQVELLPDRIIIHRKGIFNAFKHGFNARREIPLATISGIHFRDASMLRFGEIDFDHAGRSHNSKHQNKVIFSRKHQDDFYNLKEAIFQLMQQNNQK